MSFLEKPIFVSGATGLIGHAKLRAEVSKFRVVELLREGIHPTVHCKWLTVRLARTPNAMRGVKTCGSRARRMNGSSSGRGDVFTDLPDPRTTESRII